MYFVVGTYLPFLLPHYIPEHTQFAVSTSPVSTFEPSYVGFPCFFTDAIARPVSSTMSPFLRTNGN